MSASRYTVGANCVAAVSVFDGGWAAGSVGANSQSVEKLIGRVENRAEPAGCSVKFDLLFAFLPLRRPVPTLIGVALGARSKQNAIVDDFSLEFVTVVQAGGKPKFLRQCHPTADGEPRQHHAITISVPSHSRFPWGLRLHLVATVWHNQTYRHTRPARVPCLLLGVLRGFDLA